jgi:hypothetical protein
MYVTMAELAKLAEKLGHPGLHVFPTAHGVKWRARCDSCGYESVNKRTFADAESSAARHFELLVRAQGASGITVEKFAAREISRAERARIAARNAELVISDTPRDVAQTELRTIRSA